MTTPVDALVEAVGDAISQDDLTLLVYTGGGQLVARVFGMRRRVGGGLGSTRVARERLGLEMALAPVAAQSVDQLVKGKEDGRVPARLHATQPLWAGPRSRHGCEYEGAH